MAKDSRKEPNTAPQSNRWYNLALGSSFNHDHSNKFCTLRYEFKPASIDKTKPGKLHKNKDNRVAVEFQNNQTGKPKVTFEGSCEDYKENDAVLFFDGGTFRLERLHRAVKQLKHLRLPGESAAAASAVVAAAPSSTIMESIPISAGKAGKFQHWEKNNNHAMPVEVERIDIGQPVIPAKKPSAKTASNFTSAPRHITTISPVVPKNYVDEHIDIEDAFDVTPNKWNAPDQNCNSGFDINIPNQNETDEEIADVDFSGDEVDKGPNAAEALRAQVNAEGGDADRVSSSSSSSSSTSSSSGGGSSSSTSGGTTSSGGGGGGGGGDTDDEVNSI